MAALGFAALAAAGEAADFAAAVLPVARGRAGLDSGAAGAGAATALAAVVPVFAWAVAFTVFLAVPLTAGRAVATGSGAGTAAALDRAELRRCEVAGAALTTVRAGRVFRTAAVALSLIHI